MIKITRATPFPHAAPFRPRLTFHEIVRRLSVKRSRAIYNRAIFCWAPMPRCRPGKTIRPKDMRRVTLCTVEVFGNGPDKPPTKTVIGTAYLNPKDKPNDDIGMRVAFNNALIALGVRRVGRLRAILQLNKELAKRTP